MFVCKHLFRFLPSCCNVYNQKIYSYNMWTLKLGKCVPCLDDYALYRNQAYAYSESRQLLRNNKRMEWNRNIELQFMSKKNVHQNDLSNHKNPIKCVVYLCIRMCLNNIKLALTSINWYDSIEISSLVSSSSLFTDFSYSIMQLPSIKK